MKILHVLATLDPTAGGPAEGGRQSALALTSLGHEVEAASLDTPDAPFLSNSTFPVAALGPAHGKYGRTGRAVPWLREHAPRFDAVIVNGLWQYHSFATWQALRGLDVPYYVFPHGMLDPWFKRTYPLKHLKKWLYWPWAEYRVLRDARAVLFTTEEERVLARESFWLYRARERVVSYGTAPPPPDGARLQKLFLAKWPQLAQRRILLFLGRIHVKKGCDLLIRAFARIAPIAPDTHLVLAGPGSDDMLASLMALTKELGIAERVTWTGMLQGELKWGALYASDAFVLPSHQENFGVAVVEALACERPVLISDKVNIWREVSADGAGFVAPDTVAGTERTMLHWLSLAETERARMRTRAAATFQQRFTVAVCTRTLLNVLEDGLTPSQSAPAMRQRTEAAP